MKEKIFKERNLKTLLSMCFAVAMMVLLLPLSGITVHAEYHQVIGNNGQTLLPEIRTMKSAIQNNTTLKFIKKDGQKCEPAEVVNGHTANITSALIKIDKGFRYVDGQDYDIYIELTNIENAGKWVASVSDNMISLKPTDATITGRAGYNYEVWLIKAGQSNESKNRATFLFVGGSCFMCGEQVTERVEYCKPWSVDDKIYITENSQQKRLKYNDSIGGWTPNAKEELNEPQIVIFGEGTSAQHSIKGGYYCTATNASNWNGEMKFGYVVNGSIIFKDAENNITVSNIPDGQISAKIPNELKSHAPAGQHISGWIASQDVVLNDGTKILKGQIIENDQLDLILSYGDMTLTVAGYEDHHWTYSNNGDKIVAYCANCPGSYDENHKLQLTLSASTPNYTGEPVEPKIYYGTEDERTAWVAAGLTLPNPDISNPSESGYIKKTYYNADGNGQVTEVPKNVGNYVVEVEVPYGTDSVTVSVPYRIRNGADTDDTEVKAGQGKITITYMKDDQEYIVTTNPNPGTLTEDDWNGDEPSKTVGPNGVVTGLDDGQTYYVYTRKKATADNPAGEPDSVGGPYYTNVRRPENNQLGSFIEIDGNDNNKVINIYGDYEVFSDENCSPDKKVNVSDTLSPDKTYYVRRKRSGDNPASEPFAFKLDGEVAPTGLGTIPNTNPEGALPNGKVTGVTPGMEYSTDDGRTWYDAIAPGSTGNEITGLPNGKVLVRFKGSDEAFTTLWIGAGPSPSPSYESDGGGCSNGQHQYEWGDWNRVTKDEDGTMVYQCKLCGYVLEKGYIPAYAYTCLTESEHVLKTPQNGSVICEMGRWNAYPRWFFEKLATRPDVNITLKFLYQHKQYTVYIPAGTKIDTEHDWYGPLKICSLYQFEVK